MTSARTLPAKFTSSRALVWMFVIIGLLTAAGGVATATGHFEVWERAMQRIGGWVIVVFLPIALLATRSMLPRDASIELEPSRITVVRGRRRTSVRRDQLRVRVRRWEPAANHEAGVVLVLADERRTVAVGARDRRVGTADGRARRVDLWVEPKELDTLLRALGPAVDGMAVQSPGKRARELLIELTRSNDGALPILTMFAGIFGGFALTGLLGFAALRFVSESAAMIVFPVFSIGSIAVPQLLFFTRPRRGRATLVVHSDEVVLTVARHELRAKREELTIERGTRVAYARFHGSAHLPVLSIAFPDRRPLRLGTYDVRLRWPEETRRSKAPSHVMAPIDFQQLATALGLELLVDPTVGQ